MKKKVIEMYDFPTFSHVLTFALPLFFPPIMLSTSFGLNFTKKNPFVQQFNKV